MQRKNQNNGKESLFRTLLLMLVFLGAVSAFGKNVFSWRTVLYPGMAMFSQQDIDWTKNLVSQMSDLGYNGIIVGGSTMKKLEANAQYKPMMQDFVAFARQKGIQVIPLSQGQSGNPFHDETLREAFSNHGTPFVVSNGTALVKADPTLKLLNGDFEQPLVGTGWRVGGPFSLDSTEKKSGNYSLLCTDPVQQLRMVNQFVTVKPFRTYELSCWIKSANIVWVKGKERMAGTKYTVLGAKNAYIMNNRGFNQLQSNRDWTRIVEKFNSLNNNRVRINLCATNYGTFTGKVWFDDAEIREVGLYETLRKTSQPIVVKSVSGKTYTENVDYQVGDKKLIIPAGSSIQIGEELLVDWATEANVILRDPESVFCYDDVWNGLRKQLKMEDSWFGTPPVNFMMYSEWRNAGWDPVCINKYGITGQGSGPYAAATANITALLYKEANCARQAIIYNDSYDPYHNGKSSYKVTNGGLLGGGHLLDTNILVMNWAVNRKASLKYWAGVDPKSHGAFGVKTNRHRQIISCGGGMWADWLKNLADAEAEGVKDGQVVGISFHSYRGHEVYSTNINGIASACQADGRWGTGPLPLPAAQPGCPVAEIPLGVGVKTSAPVGVARPVSLNIAKLGRHHFAVRFSLSQTAEARITVTNLHGQRVATLLNERMAANTYTRKLGVSGIASGIYFVNFQATGNGYVERITRKLAVL